MGSEGGKKALFRYEFAYLLNKAATQATRRNLRAARAASNNIYQKRASWFFIGAGRKRAKTQKTDKKN